MSTQNEIERQHQLEFEAKYGKSSLFGKGGPLFFILFVFGGGITLGILFPVLIWYGNDTLYYIVAVVVSVVFSYILVNRK